jgi:hypothetical protein
MGVLNSVLSSLEYNQHFLTAKEDLVQNYFYKSIA